MFRSIHRPAGVAHADVIVVGFLAPMLFVGLLAAGKAGDEQALRTQCAANLKQIGQALQLYANDHKGRFPRGLHDPKTAEKVTAFSNWKAADPFKEGGPGPNDVTAALYLLVRGGRAAPEAFVCPATDHTPIVFGPGGEVDGGEGEIDPVAADDARAAAKSAKAKRAAAAKRGRPAKEAAAVAASPQDISNFPAPEHLSYSYANPYGFELGVKLRSNFAIAADLNPGGAHAAKVTPAQMPPAVWGSGPTAGPSAKPPKFTAAMKAANSPNHGGFGQNVLYVDGHVAFQPTPYCGMSRPGTPATAGAEAHDNIYTRHAKDGPAPPDAAGADAAAAGSDYDDPAMGPPTDSKDTVMLPVAAGPAADGSGNATRDAKPADKGRASKPKGKKSS